jgi:hypothetical protein
MKKLTLVFLVLIIALVPTGQVFAQGDDPPNIPYFCQPDVVLDDAATQLSYIEDLEDVADFLVYMLERLMTCAEPVFNAIVDMIMGGMMPPPPGGEGSLNLNANDGVLTEIEAEFAIEQAFMGNTAAANEFICDLEQIDPDEVLEGSITINSLECTSLGDIMSCDYEVVVTTDGETSIIEDTVNFEVVDGKLCEAN